MAERADEPRGISPHDLKRWLKAHAEQPDRLLGCITVRPPEHIRLLEQLPQKGMQKRVYVATWAFEDVERPVMLKQFIGEDAATTVMPRELAPHPLSMQHPNIAETHLFFNDAKEPFLVERRLPLALDETWSPGGAQRLAGIPVDLLNRCAWRDDAARLPHPPAAAAIPVIGPCLMRAGSTIIAGKCDEAFSCHSARWSCAKSPLSL